MKKGFTKEYIEKLGFPGELPFTRGVYPTMYRGRHWTMRQYAGFGTASETNGRFRYLLQQGQPGLSVAFDLPTQLGLDSDEAMARGEVGRVGVAITSSADMRELFDNIPLDKVSTSMTINATATTLLALYIVEAQRQGVAPERLRGTVQNDILKEFIARGNYIYPPESSLRLTTDLIGYCEKFLPSWYPISISGYHIREAGATALQELAFTFANGLEYVRSCQRAGLAPEKILGRLSFFFSVDNDFIEEVSKFRAARRLWATLLIKNFKISKNDAVSLGLRFHAQTGGSTLTAQQPKNNIARVTLQAMAAALGGAQSLHTNAWDEALALPSESSARLALRTQQIVAAESEVTNTVDPVAGSYVIEEKTDKLYEEALALIGEIDTMGGSVKAVERQFFQRAIADSAFKHQRAVETGARVVVGVNRFIDKREPTSLNLWSPDPAMEERQVAKLRAFKAARDAAATARALKTVRQVASTTGPNLMEPIIEAVRVGVTLGEISHALRDSFGLYRGDAAL